MNPTDQEGCAGDAGTEEEHDTRGRLDSAADEAASGYSEHAQMVAPSDLQQHVETKLSEEVAGASSYVDDYVENHCKMAAEAPGSISLRLSEVCRPLGETPDSDLGPDRYSFPTRCSDSPSRSPPDRRHRFNYLPPPFGDPAEDEDQETLVVEDPPEEMVVSYSNPLSTRVNVQFSPVSSECSDMTSSMAMSDCSMAALGATGYTPTTTPASSRPGETSAAHSPTPKLLRTSPEEQERLTPQAVVLQGEAAAQPPVHRRRKTVQIADPDTYQSFPSSVDNARYGPFGDYGRLADVDFVDVNSNELNNNTIQMDNANPRDAMSPPGVATPSTPPPRQRAAAPAEDNNYDTVSSTSSTSNLLKRVGRDAGRSSSSSNAQAGGGFLSSHFGGDVDVKLGQVLLNKTLEQVKRSLEEISPTLDTVIAPIGSSAKLMHTYLKNLVVLSIGFMFSFVAFFSLRNLQSSINHTAGLGLVSLACMYGTFVVGCLTAPPIIQRIRPKISILIFLVGNLIFIAANFYPSFYTMIPATLVLGLCQAYLWVAQGTYLTSIAVSYAVAARKRPEHILGLFNGFFLFLLQVAQIFGNLISSSVFGFAVQRASKNPSGGYFVINSTTIERKGGGATLFEEFQWVTPRPHAHRFDTEICGAAYCHVYPIQNHTADVDYQTIAMLLTIFAVLTGIGMLTIGLGLDKLDIIFHKSKLSLGQQLCTIGKLHGNLKLLLSMTLMIFLGMQEAFMYGEVTKAFITCPLGVHMIGYVMMVFGGCNAIGSFLIGQMQRCVHRIIIFSLGGMLYACLLCVMLIWLPAKDDHIFVFILAGALGFSDALWQTQICSLVGILFPSAERESAFASLRMYESVGFCIAFGYAQFLCMDIKMFILGGVLLFGMVNYYLMEFFIGKQQTRDKPTIPAIEV